MKLNFLTVLSGNSHCHQLGDKPQPIRQTTANKETPAYRRGFFVSVWG